ncbi:hypothetical protein CSKR_101661 [Clonorchis sinensis]|uniref:Uncharacterized protein n=1 Tax=Clonorchis sinensis TaxID=79923 RepID=A0A3R7CKE2_CLOSI|nr:hypothetical protein CSKR_101661 [Clonorchis sinensis]
MEASVHFRLAAFSDARNLRDVQSRMTASLAEIQLPRRLRNLFLITEVIPYIQNIIFIIPGTLAVTPGQHYSIPALVLPSGGMTARRRRVVAAEQLLLLLLLLLLLY